ncbi:MAG TPA: LapA family protein [Gaiellaceae bacterium]
MGEQEHVGQDAQPGSTGPLEETRLRRGLRYGHRGGLYASIVVIIAVGVFLILLIARNTRHVKLDYVFGSTRTGLIWLIVISVIGGWVLGILTGFLIRQRTRRPR